MKNILVSVLLFSAIPFSYNKKIRQPVAKPLPVNGNLFIITIDGFRWQEIFNGADPVLLADPEYTPDNGFMTTIYGGNTNEERRKKLLPFFWNILSAQGQLYGNRNIDNKVNNANIYSISYPGYNEIFTGTTDINISDNHKNKNPNINILEYLNSKPLFAGKVAAFTSWDVFPYILNTERNNMVINSGYADHLSYGSIEEALINKVQEESVFEKTGTRHDELTFLTAKEYVRKNQPRVVFMGLGETDEFAHQKRYDLYLEQANKTDHMIAELWHWVQTTPGYKDNTTFIITTDHGRGSKRSKWASHGGFIKGSSETWLAIIGPGISHCGEVHGDEQIYQAQIAQTIAGLLGERFAAGDPAPAISLR